MSQAENTKTEEALDPLVLQELQLLLAEKRTALATLRTGIAIFAFPLSILGALIATSKSYELHAVMHWLVPLLLINLGLTGLAVYLIVRALRRLHHYDHVIREFKQHHRQLERLLG